MGQGVVDRVLERVVERMGRRPAWDGVGRADLLVGPEGGDRPRLSPAEQDFSGAWGRAALREEDADLDEHAEYPGYGGAV